MHTVSFIKSLTQFAIVVRQPPNGFEVVSNGAHNSSTLRTGLHI